MLMEELLSHPGLGPGLGPGLSYQLRLLWMMCWMMRDREGGLLKMIVISLETLATLLLLRWEALCVLVAHTVTQRAPLEEINEEGGGAFIRRFYYDEVGSKSINKGPGWSDTVPELQNCKS